MVAPGPGFRCDFGQGHPIPASPGDPRGILSWDPREALLPQHRSSHSHWGSSRAPQNLRGATTHRKANPIFLPAPKPARELPPSLLPLYRRCFSGLFLPKPVNLSCMQRLEAPGRGPGAAVSVPHAAPLWGPRGAARAPRQGHPPSPGAGIIIPTVWEWLQGHETARAGLEPAPTRPPRTQHGLCVPQPRWRSTGGQRGVPSPPGMDSGPPASPDTESLKHHPHSPSKGLNG